MILYLPNKNLFSPSYRSNVLLQDVEAVEVGTVPVSRPARSNPVNMPMPSGGRPIVPVLIESGSGSKSRFILVLISFFYFLLFSNTFLF